MLRQLVVLFLFLLFFTIFPSNAVAVEDWVIDNFEIKINIEKDTSLTVSEIIHADFDSVVKHGIYRSIPYVYSARGKTIRSDVDVMSVTDENDNEYLYSITKDSDSVDIKIGDPDKTVRGKNTYLITYKVSDVLQRFDTYDELYWNTLGNDWDVDIDQVEVFVDSTYAPLTNGICYTGPKGSLAANCEVDSTGQNKLLFLSKEVLGNGKDFTIVLALSKDSELIFPSTTQMATKRLSDNWGYVLSLLPLILMYLLWYKKGRDKRFVDDNIYDTKASDKRLGKTTSLFERKFLPLVYRPIDNLTPSEVGVISDDTIQLRDVIAEIIELARLGFISIEKFEIQKKLQKDEVEYAFIKDDKYFDQKSRSALKDYQDYILKELFRSTSIHKSVKSAEKLFGKSDTSNPAWKKLGDKEYVLLSGLKNHFYEGLPIIKEKVYKRVTAEGYFDANPQHVRGVWTTIGIIVNGVMLGGTFLFASATANFGPLILLSVLSIPSVSLAYFMPRKSATGYNLSRQIDGLRSYLESSKWRHDIAEKKLFIEDILPLAIALGVVDRLGHDMQELGIVPPKYVNGMNAGMFASDFGSFNKSLSTAVSSSPKSSGSSWSGGSGFSGGSSGGGFGGGGGGSW